MKTAGFLVLLGLVALSAPAGAGEDNSLIWTKPERLPQTLQDIYDFGELGAPDLGVAMGPGYQSELDMAALASAASPLDDGYSFASYEDDGDDEGDKD